MCGPELTLAPDGRALCAFMSEHKVYWAISDAQRQKFQLHVATPKNEKDEIYPAAVANRQEILLAGQKLIQQTGKPAPNGEQVVKQADGTPLDTYGNINDACQLVTLFHDIMVKVGKYPNVPNWQYVVDRYGPITNRGGGQYASLTKGKYDIDDTFRLVEFDTATGGPKGGWKPLTPIYNITGTGG